MIRIPALAAAAAAVTLTLASGAGAQTLSGVSFDAGAGFRYSPDFVGSEDYDAKPWLILRNVSLSNAPAGDPASGFHIAPSASYVGKRDSDDHERLRGIDDVDASVELGLKAGYRFGAIDTYGAVRKAVNGHDGVVGEVGATYRTPLRDRLTLTSGVEAKYGNDRYMDAYFDVTPEESAASGLAAFDAKGGLRSVGVEFEVRYQANDDWAMISELRAARLVGDAADSPITEDKNQYSIGLGIVRTFNFRF